MHLDGAACVETLAGTWDLDLGDGSCEVGRKHEHLQFDPKQRSGRRKEQRYRIYYAWCGSHC